MIKKVCLVLTISLISQIGYSQILISLIFGDKLNSDKIEFGLDGGLNYSKMSGFSSGHPIRRFNLGFYFDFKLKEQWYLNTGVLVKSDVGLDFLREEDVLFLDPSFTYSSSGTYRQEIGYFHVPVAIKYRLKNHFYFRLGPQFALRGQTQIRFTGEQNGKSVEVKSKNGDQFHRLEVSAIAGIGYKLRKGEGMNIGVKYMQGLTDILKDDSRSSLNSSIYFYIGIPIGKGKAEAKSDLSKE